MIHVPALPGTPRYTGSMKEITARAANEAGLLTAGGCDGLLIENMHDVPYLCGAVGPEIVAAMTAAALAVRQVSKLPLGVQILAAANREAGRRPCVRCSIRARQLPAHVADEV